MWRYCWLIVAVLLLAVEPASAHGYILRSIPENRAVLERAPARLQYWFSEDLEPDFSSVTLRDQTGAVLAEGGMDAVNRALMTLRVPAGLPDGAYIVELRLAFASDGHVVTERRVFFVGSEVGGVTGATSGYTVLPLEVVWRVLLMASTLLIFGTAVLYSVVLVPAWGSESFRAGGLPPRVMWMLNAVLIGGLAAAVLANVLALLQQSMVFFNAGLTEVIAQNLWSVVRIGSRFGDVWTVRMLLLVLVGLLLALTLRYRADYPQLVGAFWNAIAWALALVLGTFSITAHAAGSLLWPWVAVTVDWLHTLAVGAWVGGLAALVIVLPVALRPYAGDARREALLAVLRRFSRLAVGALALVVTTGIYSASNWIYTPAELTGTAWGGALLVKVLLVGGLALLGALHHMSANPERFQRWAGRLGGLVTLRLEVGAALAALVAVAVLSATPVPEPAFLEEAPPAPQAEQTVDGLTVQMLLSPGGPGINSYDTVLTRGNTPVDDALVRLQVVNPARDWRGTPHVVDSAGDGLYIAAGDEMRDAGRWLAVYDVTLAGGDPLRLVFDWEISDEAAIIRARTPEAGHVLALAVLVGVIGWLLWPLLVRFARWLDWSPASLAAGGSAIAATVFFTVLGVILSGLGGLSYEAAINPPPALINPTMPDAASLAQGRTLFESQCPVWPDSRRDWARLVERLGRLRDEELYTITANGWQDLAACSPALAADERWHIVNYLRTFSETEEQ